MAFAAACPDVGVGVHEMGFAELLPAVATRRLALAIRPGDAESGFAGVDLWGDRAVVALHPTHPLAAVSAVDAAMLRDEIMLLSRDRARAQLHRFLADRLFARDAPATRMPATRMVAEARRCQLLERVADGEGITLLCESQVDFGMANLCIKPLHDRAARFRLRAYWRHDQDQPALAQLVAMIAASREPDLAAV